MSKKYFIPNDCDSVPKVTCHALRAIQKTSKSQVWTLLVKGQIRFRHQTQGEWGGRGGGWERRRKGGQEGDREQAGEGERRDVKQCLKGWGKRSRGNDQGQEEN